MTDLTLEEGFDLLTSFDEDIVEEFVNWYDNERGEGQSETESEYYHDIYDRVASYSYTNFDEDENEICGHDFYKKAIRYSDGAPKCYVRLAEIIDETGF